MHQQLDWHKISKNVSNANCHVVFIKWGRDVLADYTKETSCSLVNIFGDKTRLASQSAFLVTAIGSEQS